MKTFGNAEHAATDRPPFPDSTDGAVWMDRWCGTCKNEANGNTCPLLSVAMLGKTPAEWAEKEDPDTPTDRYRCTEYHRAPKPRHAAVEVSKDQLGLF